MASNTNYMICWSPSGGVRRSRWLHPGINRRLERPGAWRQSSVRWEATAAVVSATEPTAAPVPGRWQSGSPLQWPAGRVVCVGGCVSRWMARGTSWAAAMRLALEAGCSLEMVRLCSSRLRAACICVMCRLGKRSRSVAWERGLRKTPTRKEGSCRGARHSCALGRWPRVYFPSQRSPPRQGIPAGPNRSDGLEPEQLRSLPRHDGSYHVHRHSLRRRQQYVSARNGNLTGHPGGDWRLALGRPTAEVTPDGRSVVFQASAGADGRGDPYRRASTGLPLRRADRVLIRISIGQHGYNDNGKHRQRGRRHRPGFPYQSQWRTRTLFLTRGLPGVLSIRASRLSRKTSTTKRTPTSTSPPKQGPAPPSTPTYSQASGGCVSLISSGTAPGESAFIDASETGSNAFFITRQQLTPGDTDQETDLYDAHLCSSNEPCFPAQPTYPGPCDTGDSCKPAPTPQPEIFGALASATFQGPGNLRSPAPRPFNRAQKLAKALEACRKKPRRKRHACQAQARKAYGPIHKPKKRRGHTG